MGGYCSIGMAKYASKPTMDTKIQITLAKMGLSMQ
jgi:hypothetical protein